MTLSLKHSEKRVQSSQWKEASLVKGGLTPTVTRRENSQEVAPGEGPYNETDSRFNRSTSFDSTSRPLMTRQSPHSSLPRWEVPPGLLGVYNHGNTCFMNTIIQCLSNSDLVSEYFITKKFKEILNVKGIAKRLVGNTKGEVTEQFGSLLESIWSGEYTPEISNQFKNIVSKYNTQYKGSSQHDAQEFLLWLLDRLNEELHHSPKKKTKESGTKSKKEKQPTDFHVESSPEMVLSQSSGFEVYNRFQALYQSSLTCPNCGEKSNTYESYLCLSLPVPQKSLRPVFMTVVYLDDNPKQLRIALEMNVLDTVKELREKLAYELDVPPKRLILCQVYEDGFRNTFGDDQLLSDIHESETIYVFETYPLSEVNKVPSSYELIQILIVHSEKLTSKSMRRFCTPQVIRIPRDIDFNTLQKYILKSMGLAVSEEAVEANFDRAIFDIRVMDSGASDCYLATDVEMPLYTQAIDRALSTYSEEFGPAHVKFVIEWDPGMKDSIVDNDEDLYEEHQSVHKVRLNQQQPSSVSLHECLKLFTKEERLSEGDSWNCPHCPKLQEGTIKKLGLWSAPDILVIHLKRFRHSGLRRNKLNVLVNFPITDLEMGHHLLPKDPGNPDNHSTSDLYDLYGVSNHYGNMNGGHYTAFCKNPIDLNWYEFDDTLVKPLSAKEIVSRSAYLLFYQRKKLFNGTIDALQSNTHWIYRVYGPPCNTNPDHIETQSETDTSSEPPPRPVLHLRTKSEPASKKGSDSHRNEAHLRREINSPRREDRSPNMDINSPRQQKKIDSWDSPRKTAPPNYPTLVLDKNYVHEPSQRSNTTVAEQIIKSKLMADQVDGKRLSPRGNELIRGPYGSYHRSGSADSLKNNHNYASSSEASSAPASPMDDVNGMPAEVQGSHRGRVDGKSMHALVLNNAREFHGMGSNGISSKLKIHSNQIHIEKDTVPKSPIHDTKVHSEVHAVRKSNPKNTNVSVDQNSALPPPPARRDVFSTPQQTRKSPSPPVQNGHWSTPQPQRKQFSEYRPPMDRQSSVPSRDRPLSCYDGHQLQVEGRGLFDDQPRSLPTDTKSSSDKPPLPKSHLGTRPGTATKSRVTETKPARPSTAHAVSRDPVHTGSGGEGRMMVNGTEAPVGRERSRLDDHRHDHRQEVRHRNRSADRLNGAGRRSVRSKGERPMSYHQSTFNNDYEDQYYLSQPVDTGNLGRSSHYATMRPPRPDPPKDYTGPDMLYLAGQLAERQYTGDVHQARSRAPLPYNPSRYQETVSHDMPRYQPHLHTAKFMSRLAQQDKLIQQKMKNQYLKESSV